jgi:hypothetical protein
MADETPAHVKHEPLYRVGFSHGRADGFNDPPCPRPEAGDDPAYLCGYRDGRASRVVGRYYVHGHGIALTAGGAPVHHTTLEYVRGLRKTRHSPQ